MRIENPTFGTALAAGLVVAAAVGGGVYLYREHKAKKARPKSPPGPVPLPLDFPVPLIDGSEGDPAVAQSRNFLNSAPPSVRVLVGVLGGREAAEGAARVVNETLASPIAPEGAIYPGAEGAVAYNFAAINDDFPVGQYGVVVVTLGGAGPIAVNQNMAARTVDRPGDLFPVIKKLYEDVALQRLIDDFGMNTGTSTVVFSVDEVYGDGTYALRVYQDGQEGYYVPLVREPGGALISPQMEVFVDLQEAVDRARGLAASWAATQGHENGSPEESGVVFVRTPEDFEAMAAAVPTGSPFVISAHIGSSPTADQVAQVLQAYASEYPQVVFMDIDFGSLLGSLPAGVEAGGNYTLVRAGLFAKIDTPCVEIAIAPDTDPLAVVEAHGEQLSCPDNAFGVDSREAHKVAASVTAAAQQALDWTGDQGQSQAFVQPAFPALAAI